MSEEYCTCPFCGVQEETALEGDSCSTLGFIEHNGEWYHPTCLNDYLVQFKTRTLKGRIDRSRIMVTSITIPANTNLISLDVTDKIEEYDVAPANVRALATPDFPVAVAVNGRSDAGRYYMDVGITPQQTFDVHVTVLVFEVE